ncbi:hypothetical protein D9M68_634040 [compost metagenome]
MTVPDDEYWPTPSRVTLPEVVAVWPLGPVRSPLCEQVPPTQLVLPSCCTGRPLGPTAVPLLLNWPGAVRVTVPVLVARPPCGPSMPPACEQLPPPQAPMCPLLKVPRGV